MSLLLWITAMHFVDPEVSRCQFNKLDNGNTQFTGWLSFLNCYFYLNGFNFRRRSASSVEHE